MNDEREATVEHLGELLRADLIDIDAFEVATGRVLAARTSEELALVVGALPSPVRMTPPERRMQQPLIMESRSSALSLTSTFQLARETRIESRSGAVVIDLGVAEFDDPVIDLYVTVSSGATKIVVPQGIGVQLVEVKGRSSAMRNDLGPSVTVPGMPLVRLHLTTNSGAVRLMRPKSPRARRFRFRFWRRRRSDD